ncbi:MAG: hypothetical protein AAB549_01635, partial [Patescibacteria group bacterium]
KDPVVYLGEAWRDAHAVAVLDHQRVVAEKQLARTLVQDEDVMGERVLYGCTVQVPVGIAHADRAVESASTEFELVQAEAEQAKAFECECLTETGIAPLAVVPTNIWEQVTKAWGLVRFEYLEHSRAYARTVSEPPMPSETRRAAWMYSISACIALCMVAILAIVASVYWWGAAFVAVFLSWCAYVLVREYRTKSKARSAYEQRKQTPGGFVSELWPDGHDYYEYLVRMSDFGEFCQLPVAFPNAPKSFVEKLLRLESKRVHCCIAAAPEAIHVKLSEARPAPNADPILYIKSPCGGFVAVLDRFGNFENEARAVQQAQDITAQYYA